MPRRKRKIVKEEVEEGRNKGTQPKVLDKDFKIKMEPKQVIPYTTKLDLPPKVVDRLIEKIIYEQTIINEEKEKHNDIFQENTSVKYRFKKSGEIYSYKVHYTNYPFDHCSNIPGIIVPTAVDGARANLVKAIMVDPLCQAVQESDIDTAQAKEKYLQYKIRSGIKKSKEEQISWLHTALLKGSSFIWHYDKKVMKKKKSRKRYKNAEDFLSRYPQDKYPELIQRLQAGEEISLVENEPKEEYVHCTEWIDPATMLIHDTAKDVNVEDFVGREVKYTVEQLVEEDFDNLEEVLTEDDIRDSHKINKEINAVHAVMRFDITDYDEGEEGKKNKKRKKEKIFVVADVDNKVLLYAIKYPPDHDHCWYIPMHVGPYQGYFWRQGLYDKLKGVHETHKETVDLILNSAKVTYIPSFKALKKGSFDPTVQDWYPGVCFWLDHMEDVVQWDIRPSHMQLEQMLPMLQQYGFEESGMSPYTQGTPTSSGESGRKIQLLLTAGGVRLEEMAEHIKEAYNELFYQILEIARQRQKEQMKIYTNGRETVIDPKIFESGSNSYISTLDLKNAHPEVILQRDMQVLEVEMNNPLVQSNMESMRILHTRFIKHARMGWEDVAEDILPTQEELHEQQVQIQMEAIKRIEEERLTGKVGFETGNRIGEQGGELNLKQGSPGLPQGA